MAARAKGLFLILLGGMFVFNSNIPIWADEDIEKDKVIKETWEQITNTMFVDAQDNSLENQWRDYYQKYPQAVNASRAMYMIAETLFKQKFYEKAFQAYDEFLKRYPNESFSDSAAYRMGECLYNQKSYKEAILQWNKLIERYSRTFFRAEAYYGQILSYISIKKWRDATTAIDRLSQEFPHYRKEMKVKIPLGLVYYHNQQYQQALQYFQSVDGDLATYYMGRCQENLGQFLPAAAKYKSVVEKFPDSIYVLDAAYSKADSYYKGNNYSVAAKEFQYFLTKYPQSLYRAYALYKSAVCEIRQEDYAGAKKFLDSLLAEETQRSVLASNALYLKGECLRQMKQPEAALAAYNQVVADYPNAYVAGSAKFKAGWTLLRNGQTQLALTMFREFLTTYPIHENVQLATYLLGNTYFKQELYAQAIPIYQNILMKYKYSDISDAALAALQMAFYIPKQYEQLISTTHYILKVLAANFPPSKSTWRSLSYFYLGEAYFHMTMYAQAAGQYKKIVENFSDSPILNWAKIGLAYSYFELEQYKEARIVAKDVMDAEDAPEKLKNYCSLLIAHCQFNSKKFEDAIVNYETFAKTNPKMPEAGDAYFHAGVSYYELEYFANAIDAWQKVVQLYSESEKAPEAAYRMADTFFKAQKYDEAIRAFQMLEKWPDEKNTYRKEMQLHIAQCYYNAKKDDLAIAAYKKFVIDYPDDPKVKDAMEGIQLSFYRKGASADAVPQLMEFVSKFPSSKLAVDALYRVGEIYYQEKKMDLCIAAFQQVIADYPESSVLPNAQYYVAICNEGLGDKDKAIRSYQAFIRNFPTHELVADVRFRLASAYFAKEQYEEAVDMYQTIVEFNAKTDYAPNALFNIALCFKKTKQWKKAIDTYTDYYKKYPNDPKAKECLMQIANTYRDEKRFPSAIKVFEEMVENKEFADQKGELMYSIADAYMQMEDKDNAALSMEKMRELRPRDDVYRLTALAKLGTLYEELQKWGNAYIIYADLAISGKKPEWVQAARSRMSMIKLEHADDVAKVENKLPKTEPAETTQPVVQKEEKKGVKNKKGK